MSGARPGTAHQVHRTIRTALGEAHRRGHVSRNVAALAKPPRVQVEPVRPYSVDEVQRILEAAMQRPNGARWAIALALGLRQGEAAGLRWEDVDLETWSLRIRGTRPRPVYGHGCGGTCGRSLASARSASAESGGWRRQVAGRPTGCGSLWSSCSCSWLIDQCRMSRGYGAPAMAGRRLGVRLSAGQPLSLNSDYREWKALLRAAGVPDGRLHDARHTAATVLLVLGVPERTVMSVMGWSSTSMAARYQHVTDPIRRDVADRSVACCGRSGRTPRCQLRLQLRPIRLETLGSRQGRAVSVSPSQEWRRMRDSNPRGLAPNPLSKRAP